MMTSLQFTYFVLKFGKLILIQQNYINIKNSIFGRKWCDEAQDQMCDLL